MSVSVVIRTYNEERHLGDLLKAIRSQAVNGVELEAILVDSGSTDRTLDTAKQYECNIVHIASDDFTFGRSLNMGCEAAAGDFLVFVSGHCVPENGHWLRRLLEPLRNGVAAYSYGRQIGGNGSKFSETQLFAKHFPATSKIPQEGFFCNNANAALRKDVWRNNRFNEELPGLEDMELAKRLVHQAMKVGYVAEATVHHLHDENWMQVRRRYEREAIALQHVMPQVHVHFVDFLRYYVGAVLLDVGTAIQEKRLKAVIGEILMFRLMQYWGTYRGNHEHRKLSKEMKEMYFFPKVERERA